MLTRRSGCRKIEARRRKTGRHDEATQAPSKVRTDRVVDMPPSEPAAIYSRNRKDLCSPLGPPRTLDSTIEDGAL